MSNVNALEINSYKKFKEILLFHIKRNDVIMVQGAPGIGKSEIIRDLIIALNKSNNNIFDYYNERLYQRGDFAPGAPYIDEKNMLTSYTVPIWLDKILKSQQSKKLPVLVLDDAHLIKPYIQDMLYEYFEKNTLNEAKSSPHPIILMGNWGIESAKSYNVQSPVMGRLAGFYRLVPNLQEWLIRYEKVLHPKIRAFLIKHNDLFFTDSPEEMEKFHSPRDWLRFNCNFLEHPMKQNCALSYIGLTAGRKFINEYDFLVEDIDELMGDDQISMESQILTAEHLGLIVPPERVNEVFNYIHKNFDSVSQEPLLVYYNIIYNRHLISELKGNKKAGSLAKVINDLVSKV